MGTFKDIGKAIEDVSYRQGFERGVTIQNDRRNFLKNTKLWQMKLLSKKKIYQELFDNTP
jgi:hypothetical protein